MKKTILFLSLICSTAVLFAQTKPAAKPVKKPATAAAAPKPLLKNLADSAGYALGVDVASSLQAQSMTKINRPLITKSLNDVLDGKASLIDENSCFLILNNYSTKMAEEKAKPASKTPATPAKVNPANSKAPLKTLADSAGYALGVNIATSLKLQNMTSINRVLISKALNDALSGKPILIPKANAYQVLVSYANKLANEKASVVIAEGQAFLEKNKLRPEVVTTPSGLQYEILKQGTGIKPTAVDTFVAHYRGTLINGTEFEQSRQPLVYPVGGVVPGWVEGLQLMAVGSKYKFYIPYNLGYGLHGNPPAIPGGAALIFELELLDVKKRK